MHSAIREINEEYQVRLRQIKTSKEYDEIEMSGSSALWKDILTEHYEELLSEYIEDTDIVSAMAKENLRLMDTFL